MPDTFKPADTTVETTSFGSVKTIDLAVMASRSAKRLPPIPRFWISCAMASV